ncbi:MAG: hypothetical protein IT442_14940 [Phycisphaeraceae bacterium]|nr:hypothetical protein [Phycisphaeraceae bacterium]MCC7409357.1 hypothetical protein [Phycisphaeraceae bacterium]
MNRPCPEHQYERVCKGEFAALHAKLDRMDEAIRGTPGNGNPGIKVRLDRLEQAQAVRSRLMWIIAGSVASLAVAAVWKLVIGG